MLLNGITGIDLNVGIPLGSITQPQLLQLGKTLPAQWYNGQPAFNLIHASSALSHSTGKGVIVADINSQIDFSHPALKGHLTGGYDFIANQPTSQATSLNQSDASFLDQSDASFLDQSDASFLDQSDASFLDGLGLGPLVSNPAYGHGTMCAGIIAAVAPDAMIMPLRAFDSNGNTDLFTLAKAINYAVVNGAQVINMSFGTLTNSNAIQTSIQFAEKKNVILTAAAGNNNTSAPQYPAAYPGVLTVAAVNNSNVKASFSNYGSYIDVSAPGVNIISAYPNDQYSVASGTSFSAPIVAGEAALVRSLQMNAGNSVISGTVVNINSQNPHYANKLGTGRIDILNAVTHP
jgi:subtilisin family serine protease